MPSYRNSVRGFILPIRNFSEIGVSKIAPIFFQSNPQITDSKSASYGGDTPMGRAEGFLNYSSSTNRSFSLTLQYTAVSSEYDTLWVAQQVSRIKALVYPIYSRSNRTAKETFATPPMILLNYGLQYVNIPCKVLDYSSNIEDGTPIDSRTMLPYVTTITINLQTSYPYGYVPGHDDIATKFSSDDPNGDRGDSILPSIGVPNIENSRYEKESPFPRGISADRQNIAARYNGTNATVAKTRPLGSLKWGN